MAKLSFVYFDVGGVAIKDFSDSNKWDVMLKVMGLDKFDRRKVDEIYDSREDEVCIGQKHIDSILPVYIQEFNLTIDPHFSMQKYFVDHFEINRGIWPIITHLKTTTPIGLLTDIYPGMLDMIFSANLLPPVEWDQVVDSTLVGSRKPMPAIYQVAQDRAGVPAAEILLVDNRQKNIDGAIKADWQGYFYDSSNYDQANKDLAALLQL